MPRVKVQERAVEVQTDGGQHGHDNIEQERIADVQVGTANTGSRHELLNNEVEGAEDSVEHDNSVNNDSGEIEIFGTGMYL